MKVDEYIMVMTEVKWPKCGCTNVSKNGKNGRGIQGYICNGKRCVDKLFILECKYSGWKTGIDKDITNMTANASGIRDIVRVLGVSKQKVQDTKKQQNQ